MTSNVNCAVDITKEMHDQSDLSDKEDAQDLDFTPLHINWLDLQLPGCEHKLGISELPGCRYQKTWRSVAYDVECLKASSVEHIFCLCSDTELKFYRASKLLSKYNQAGLTVHHFPIEDGGVPEIGFMLKMLEELRVCLLGGKKTLIHCFGGLGRSCLVAACLMMLVGEQNCENALETLKNLKDSGSLFSVKQYNYVNEFEQSLREYKQEEKGLDSRSVSR